MAVMVDRGTGDFVSADKQLHPYDGCISSFKDFNYMKGVFGSDWCGFKNFEFLFKTKDAFIMTRNTLLYNAAFIVIGTILLFL